MILNGYIWWINVIIYFNLVSNEENFVGFIMIWYFGFVWSVWFSVEVVNNGNGVG